MRRRVSAILILFVFLSLQFGKITTYLYCKWQAEVVQNQPDCGCDKHLTTLFDHDETGATGSIAKIAFKEKITEYSPQPFIVNLLVDYGQKKSCFAGYDSPLLKIFITPPFHPPAA